MCLASSCRLRLTLKGNWWSAKQFPHVVREEKCAVTFSKFFDQAADHPLVDKGGEYNPGQVSFVRARNVNGKCGAKNK